MKDKHFYRRRKLTLNHLLVSLPATLFVAVFSSAAQSGKADLASLETDAMVIAKKFGGTLKPQLKKALQTGGPLQAVEICSEKAPIIAKQLALETGWDVKRVSLKARNHKTAKPDSWETEILQQFHQRQRSGESPIQMIQSEVVDGHYRFMKAQAVETICLTCHGQQLDSEVENTINQHYPNDQATGYSLGQIRGAFSLSKKIAQKP